LEKQGMPGHMGDERVTVQNLRVIQIREDDGVILVRRRPAPMARTSSSVPQKKLAKAEKR
jgi:large subunit ribosomal protein L3